MAAVPKKMSFAKVLATSTKDSRLQGGPAARVAVPSLDRRGPIPSQAGGKSVTSAPAQHFQTSADPLPVLDDNKANVVDRLSQGIAGVALGPAEVAHTSAPNLVVNGSSATPSEQQTRPDVATPSSDETSQKADSASEMGTKPPSLDGKSIASGTTFALDEKESLRPDDSASVQAAADDDEAFSVRGSLLATSRGGSEVARIHRLRIGDMPERRIVQLLPETHDQGLSTPQSGVSSQQPPTDPSQILGPGNGADPMNSVYGQNPDEKLIEAMKSPKDRIFLLRLEQDVINFVQSSKEPYMDLPPNNSFCRMLTHKLADYYHMTHSFEAVQGAVRIYRTPFCRVPPSLASIMENSVPPEPEVPAQPVMLPRKIMRRGEDDGSGNASNSASKATSEVGSDGKGKPKTKEKLTREEREEAYKQARERIFGKEDKASESNDGEDMSRASSMSGKDRSTLGKRGKTSKQRRDDSESFDSRSQYTAYYGHPHQPTWTPQYVAVGNQQYAAPPHAPFQQTMPSMYQNSTQPYSQGMPMNGYGQYGNTHSYPQQPQAQLQTARYPAPQGMMAPFGPPMQPGPQQNWVQPQQSFSNQTPPSPYQHRSSPAPMGPAVPYAFGQLPAHVNPHDPKSQHPIPGSYNRHAFNPKTQSFVPGSGMSPVQSAIAPYNTGPMHGSPQIGTSHLAYGSYAPSSQQPYIGASSYGMSRQSSSNSLPPYHQNQHISQPTSAPMAQLGQQTMPMKPGMPPHGYAVGPNTQAYGHLPNYGNPATLPQKPSSGI
ncbi:uncharacterized protein B0I36DRAFT_365878 [Microdochium trichocladiopsis]|uniref:R3H domain-containing protein n=1 Tax=Microdochium trichocladiopsis TaxID=1682393 RepID=A0A9P9BMV7_9PEZI|nr:uncharacterized protein B0I36DRAFT_365878 [Microdochium trichocladiopsis]KAH7026291.1 hypothetical protein B0I36DRAFT_365878 [Microdochium trichocladiopsis]